MVPSTGLDLAALMRGGNPGEFAALTEPYRRELHMHCYRMLASFDEAEDMVQETLLRAWRARESFEGRATIRTWLYRIATNVCLDTLESRSRRLPSLESLGADEPNAVKWLQPYPDRLLDEIASSDSQPDASVIERETIELAYLVAIQYLPPRQRAVLILRDSLGWSAKETASLLGDSVASVNSALNRARSLMRKRLPEERPAWSRAATPTAAERKLLERYMAAIDGADSHAMAALLREEVRLAMPPFPTWFEGREDVLRAFELSTDPSSTSYLGQLRTVATGANRQPALAAYARRSGDRAFRPLGIDVLRLEADSVIEITRFVIARDLAINTGLFARFGLPATL